MYLVFAGSNYYPEGGFHDWIGSSPILDAAKELLVNYSNSYGIPDWYHIVDLDSFTIIISQDTDNFNVFYENQ